MQNNRFYNTLIKNKLNDSYYCEKFLHQYGLFSPIKQVITTLFLRLQKTE
ncbi:Uncharacterised protein [Prevotella intermedia]|nr:Uncharacterised protein [Prevotella intermedia]